MGELQYLLINISGLAVTYFVPAIVWGVLIVGVYQLVRQKIRHVCLVPRGPQQLAQAGYGQQVG